MKKLLIVVNCILAFLLALSIWAMIFNDSGPEQAVPVKKKKKNKTTVAAVETSPAKFKFPDSASVGDLIVRKNIFDSQRTGGTVGRGAQTYSLVGITRVGNFKSATILIKGGVRHNNGRQLQQHLRIGDALPNGYVLSEVYNDSVVLTRGPARMELYKTMPSENFPSGGGRRRAPNQMQQMLDLMRQSIGLQQRQNRDMMQMMRDSGSSSRGGSSNRRRR